MDSFFGLLLLAIWLLIYRKIIIVDDIDEILIGKVGKKWRANIRKPWNKLFFWDYRNYLPGFLYYQNYIIFISALLCFVVSIISIHNESSAVVTITTIYAFFLTIYTYICKTIIGLLRDTSNYNGLSKIMFILTGISFVILLVYCVVTVVAELL